MSYLFRWKGTSLLKLSKEPSNAPWPFLETPAGWTGTTSSSGARRWVELILTYHIRAIRQQLDSFTIVVGTCWNVTLLQPWTCSRNIVRWPQARQHGLSSRGGFFESEGNATFSSFFGVHSFGDRQRRRRTSTGYVGLLDSLAACNHLSLLWPWCWCRSIWYSRFTTCTSDVFWQHMSLRPWTRTDKSRTLEWWFPDAWRMIRSLCVMSVACSGNQSLRIAMRIPTYW